MMQTTSVRDGKRLFTTATSKRKYFWSPERRRYVRYPCAWGIKFCELGEKPSKLLHVGKCKNLSGSGMKLSSLEPLSRKAIVLLELNVNLIEKHVKLKNILQISENRILAEVTWRHLNLDTGVFEAGLRFLETRKRNDYESLIAKANAI